MEKILLVEEETKILQELQAELNRRGKNIFIADGVINPEQYLSAEPKILWINKEVNSEDEEDCWDLKTVLNDLEENGKVKKGWENTFNPIIYTVYGIINKKNWEEIPNTWDSPEIIKVLQKIAYVNMKKTPGISKSHARELTNFHSDFANTLEQQIKLYNPDIIICGNTYEIIAGSLEKNL